MNTIQKITLIGAGNVATHLGKALFLKDLIINQIYSKSLKNASALAAKLDAAACNNIQELNNKSDLYIISIKDDAIQEVISHLPFKNKLIVHTSGSIAMNILASFSTHGIFYPLQTFSKNKDVDMSEVPFCIEANQKETEEVIFNLAKTLSKNVTIINSEQRKKIHLAAVFACNFSNYMYTISEEILKQENINFDIMRPLILETAKKIQEKSPKIMQTGPAKRNDKIVIENQLKMLANNEDYQDIYKILTDNIINSN